MPSKKDLGLFTIVSALTTLLTASLMFLAPLPARYLHLNFGRTAYWAFAVVSSVALYFVMPQWALSQFTLMLLIGLFTDLERQKMSTFYAASAAVFIAGVSFILLLSFWAKTQNLALSAMLKKNLTEAMASSTTQLKDLPVPVDINQLLALFPAIVAILLMLLIFFSLVFIRPSLNNEKVTAFKVPDYVIWVFIVTLAGSFLVDPVKQFVLHKVFYNGLYICAAAYYFQGLAIIGFFSKRMKLNYLLKAAFFFILAFHLFMFVAALGLSDVWFSYRSKWYKNLLKNNPYTGEQ